MNYDNLLKRKKQKNVALRVLIFHWNWWLFFRTILFLKKQKAQGNDPLKISTSYYTDLLCIQLYTDSRLLWWLNGKESAADIVSISGSRRFPEEGEGNPLQYSCLENPMDGGACKAIVHRVTKESERTEWLNDIHWYKKMLLKSLGVFQHNLNENDVSTN